MGLYFNPGNEAFLKDARSMIYVDKTELIGELNNKIGSNANCIALSHARRFGKSQAADMISAYYSSGCDSRGAFETFKAAKLDSFEKHLNKYNVIHLDISSVTDCHSHDLIKEIKDRIYTDLKKVFNTKLNYELSFERLLNEVYKLTGRLFVIIIDEWDCVIRNYADDEEMVHSYMRFLHALFKSKESKEFLALGYITGILPIIKIKDESALNNFKEYTMVSSKNLTRFYGFTEDEVRELCDKYNMEFEAVKNWYNGYLIDGIHMYNPNSVYNCMMDGSLESYWKNTSAFSTINTFIEMNYEGLKDDIISILAGESVEVNVNFFKNDLSVIASKDDCLTALIHLGYLGYDAENEMAYMPNYEIATAFDSALQTGAWEDVAKAVASCNKLLKATIKGDSEKVAEYLEYAHETYTSNLHYNNESSLNTTILMAYFTARAYYEIVPEFPSRKGFADFAFIPRSNAGARPAFVVELKWDKGADTAIRQIKEKRYAGRLSGYSQKVLLVAVNYDKETKKHECVIEEIKTNRD